jgi:hypothetical protein
MKQIDKRTVALLEILCFDIIWGRFCEYASSLKTDKTSALQGGILFFICIFVALIKQSRWMN